MSRSKRGRLSKQLHIPFHRPQAPAANKPPLSQRTRGEIAEQLPGQQISHPPTSANPQRGAYGASLIVCLPIVLVTFVAVYLAYHGRTQSVAGGREDDTAALTAVLGDGYRKVLNALWTAGNNSFDPCHDFHQFTCYNHRDHADFRTVFSLHDWVHRVLVGLSRTEPGRLLFTYYRACVGAAQRRREDTAKDAIYTMLDTFNLASDQTPLSVFTFILKASIRYGVYCNLEIFQFLYGVHPRVPVNPEQFEVPQPLFVLAKPALFFGYDPFGTNVYLEPILEELRSRLKVDITREQLIRLASVLQAVTGDGIGESDLGVLDRTAPGVRVRIWRDIVEDSTTMNLSDRVFHSPLEVLAHRFRILLDKKQLRFTTAFLATEMTINLVLANTPDTNNPSSSHSFCYFHVLNLMPVWFLDGLLRFSAKTEHNQALMTMFDLLIDTIVAEVKPIVDARDAVAVERKLRALRLILPYHVFPLDLPLPVLGQNYFSAILLVRQYRLTVKRYRVASGVPQSLAHVHLPQQFLQTPGFVSFPPYLYTSVPFDRKTSLLRAAISGFMMADQIWSIIFDTRWTQPASGDSLERAACNSSVYGSAAIKRPYLALRSSLRVTSIRGWHEWRHYWGQWRYSLSQVFYRLVAFQFYCNDYLTDPSSLRHELQHAVSHNGDFLTAFQCDKSLVTPCVLSQL